MKRVARYVALAALGILLAVTPSAPQAAGISLAWDPSVGPVDGYLVHVGTSSGWYEQVFDAGPRTSFTYRDAVPGTEYFFVVTAYRNGHSSSFSQEVSGSLGEVPAPVHSRPFEHAGMSGLADGGAPQAHPPDASVTAVCLDAQSCYAVRLRARGLAPVSALAVTPGGDLLVVESGKTVRLVHADGGFGSEALRAPEGHRITDVAVGPEFARSGHVYVGVTHPGEGMAQVFSIVRYRSVLGRMGEAAVIVPGLPVVNSQSPRMTIDGLGRLYVAMPAGNDRQRDPSAGSILRFDADGTTAANGRTASPIFAPGFEIPSGLVTDAGSLWVYGVDGNASTGLGRLALDEPAEATRTLLAADGHLRAWAGARLTAFSVSLEATPEGHPSVVAFIDAMPRLHVARVPAEAHPVVLRNDGGDLLPDAVLVGPHRRIYVAARDGRDSTLLLELIPR